MKIIILKEKLVKGLNIVERIIGKNLTLPILNNVLISAEENSLKLSATDLELGISYWGLAKVEEKGKITIPAKTLSSFVSFLDEEKLTIETKEKVLFLKGENYKTQIKGLEAKDYPIIPDVASETWLELNARAFCEGMMQVIDFCALTQVRPELSGIYLSFQKNVVKIVSTDSFRLAEKTIALDNPTNNLTSVQSLIIPRNAARELVNIFSEQDRKIKFYLSPSQIMIESYFSETNNPQARLVSRLIEGEYPKKESITISSQNVDLGETHSNLSAKIKGEETVASFNYKFLAEGLGQIKTKEVIFELNGQDGPGVLKPTDDPSYIYVIMPIKGN